MAESRLPSATCQPSLDEPSNEFEHTAVRRSPLRQMLLVKVVIEAHARSIAKSLRQRTREVGLRQCDFDGAITNRILTLDRLVSTRWTNNHDVVAERRLEFGWVGQGKERLGARFIDGLAIHRDVGDGPSAVRYEGAQLHSAPILCCRSIVSKTTERYQESVERCVLHQVFTVLCRSRAEVRKHGHDGRGVVDLLCPWLKLMGNRDQMIFWDAQNSADWPHPEGKRLCGQSAIDKQTLLRVLSMKLVALVEDMSSLVTTGGIRLDSITRARQAGEKRKKASKRAHCCPELVD